MIKSISNIKQKLLFHRYLLSAFFLIFLFQHISNTLFAQSTEDITQFSKLFETKKAKPENKAFLKGNSNELEFLSSAFFVFYKEFFSSQDGNHCVFYPSCSVYSIQAIKKQGIIIGTMNGIDRLSRCNRLSPENYKTYKNTNLFYDPLD